jgi:hypothetical protein
MPIRFTYDPQLKVLFTTAEGLISFAEIQRHMDEETAAKALGYSEIVDACAASTNVTSEEARELARRIEALMRAGPFGRTAVIATNDVAFGMVRMLSILSEVWSGPGVADSPCDPLIEAFRSFEEGLHWLQMAGTCRAWAPRQAPGRIK